MKKSLLILAFFASYTPLAFAIDEGQVIIGTRVTVEHTADGDVIATEEPMSEEECVELASARGMVSGQVKILQQRLQASEVKFNQDVFGRSLVARELQLCLAKDAPEETTELD